MACVGEITVSIGTEGADEMIASFTSVFEVLGASDAACECFSQRFPGVFDRGGPGLFVASDDTVDLLLSEAVAFSAGGTGKLIALKFNPADRYIEAVAAIAAIVGDAHVTVRHGWPILSLGPVTPSVTEAAGAGNCAFGLGRGGAA